ncbi:MAG: hypothetical protein ACRDHZ_08765, partial [Ktedonobacteraceae bacterium]
NMDKEGFISFNVPLEYCRALIAEARQQNKRARHKMPVAYAVWRRLIETGCPVPQDATSTLTMLEPQVYDEALGQLAARGDELYRLPEFEPWVFEPFAQLHPYVNEYLGPSAFPLSEHTPGTPGRKRKISNKQLEAQKREREALVDTVLEKTVDMRWRLLYDTRLRRQAALFQLLERTEDVDLISAVAATLHPDSGVSPQQQPFLRALVHRSLERGLIHMMTEMLETASLLSSPLNFFKKSDNEHE